VRCMVDGGIVPGFEEEKVRIIKRGREEVLK